VIETHLPPCRRLQLLCFSVPVCTANATFKPFCPSISPPNPQRALRTIWSKCTSCTLQLLLIHPNTHTALYIIIYINSICAVLYSVQSHTNEHIRGNVQVYCLANESRTCGGAGSHTIDLPIGKTTSQPPETQPLHVLMVTEFSF